MDTRDMLIRVALTPEQMEAVQVAMHREINQAKADEAGSDVVEMLEGTLKELVAASGQDLAEVGI